MTLRLARVRTWRPCARALRGVAAALLAVTLAGCASISFDLAYYLQSVRGHFAIMREARPIDELLAQAAVDERVAPKLKQALAIREFASRELALPANGSYTRYADLGRPFVVWNVFAAPELSLRLRRWCFPVAGCVSYKGYFDRADADRLARSLRAEGLEVQVAGIPAYSTLGWFDDPVLNTFIHYPEGELARLIFHELAHQVVYLKGDSTFNESFATAVEEVGVERWFATRNDPQLAASYRAFAERRRQFVDLLRKHREQLEAVYASAASDDDKRVGKARVFASLRAEYGQLKLGWGGFSGYDRWFGENLGNAHLASVATYNALVPGFRRLLESNSGDLPAFYEAVRRLAREEPAERERRLATGG